MRPPRHILLLFSFFGFETTPKVILDATEAAISGCNSVEEYFVIVSPGLALSTGVFKNVWDRETKSSSPLFPPMYRKLCCPGPANALWDELLAERTLNGLLTLSTGARMSQILKTVLTCLLGAFFVPPSAIGQQMLPVSDTALSGKSSAGIAAADTTFLKKALSGGVAEVEFGRLAVAKASSSEVKQFGQRMIDDHGRSNEQLKQVAAREHVTLPQGLTPKDKAAKASLENLSGGDFDRAYMEQMVRDHKKDVAEFERQSKSAFDPAVKNFAAQTLPMLREHLKEARRVAPTQQALMNSTR